MTIIDPYQVLGLNPTATADEIRQQYLALVRESPPERDPQRFAQIRDAYDQLRDPVASLERQLLDTTAVHTFDTLLAAENKRRSARRLPTAVLLSLAEA